MSATADNQELEDLFDSVSRGASCASAEPAASDDPADVVNRVGKLTRQLHDTLSELLLVDDMRTRKHLMLTRSEAVIALPGGTGTFEELLETLTLKRLGLWTGPVVIVNRDGSQRTGRVLQVFGFKGLERIEVPEADPGERPRDKADRRVMRRLVTDRRVVAAVLVVVSFRYSIGVFEPLWATHLDRLGASTMVVTLSLTGFALPMLLVARWAGSLSKHITAT